MEKEQEKEKLETAQKEEKMETTEKPEKEVIVLQKTPTPIKSKKEAENENEQEPSLMHNLNVLALAASPEIRQMEEGRIKNAAAAPGSSSSSVDDEATVARIGCVRKQFQAALESATPESQLMLHDYEMSTCHVNSSKQRQKPVRSIKTRNRKTKSLAVISRRFLERLPLYPSVGDPVVLSLNHLPTELGVERRRIYDILNILESVEMVRRLGRNQYQYLGYARLPTALAELRHQGQCEGLRELIEIAERERRDELAEKRERRKRENEAVLAAEKKRQLIAKATSAQRSSLSSAIELLASAAGKVECEESGVEDDDEDTSSSDESSSPSSPVPAGENSISSSTDVKPVLSAAGGVAAAARQTVVPPGGLIVTDHNMVTGNDDAASLGVICRRFLMLLLVSDPPVVTLNTAARVVGCQVSSATMPRQTVVNTAGQAVHVVEKENSGPSTSVSSSRYNSSTVFKSKLRRLYDVTNVLATVGLVKREVDGIPVDKADDGEDGAASPSPSSSPSAKNTKDTASATAVKEEDKHDSTESDDKKLETTTAATSEGASSNTAVNTDRKLRGPVFRYTGPPISSLPPVSASRLSELPSSTGVHRQGSHTKTSAKCQLLVRNGSGVAIPPGSSTSASSLVIVPGSTKALRIVASGSQVVSAVAVDDNAPRQIVAPLGLARARTFTSGIAQATVLMPSTPLLAPPRLANFAQAQPSATIRPNSLLGKLLGSQNTATTTANGVPVPGDQSDNAGKRQKAPSAKRMVLSSDGDGFSAKQSRLSHPAMEPWTTQERIVVIGPSASANSGSVSADRTSLPLIVSHAQLSMQKSSQHMQKPTVGDADDEVVVVVQDQQANSAKIIVSEKTSPGSTREAAEFLHHHNNNNNSNAVPVKDVVDWLC